MRFKMNRHGDWYVSHDDGGAWEEIAIKPSDYTFQFDQAKCLLPLGSKYNKENRR